ncbi:hypothetical protein SAMN02910298_02656 [Pseudobutyrivibrio sp. YE44]|uniref:hypothetical protein n=1 Tax=Pseudobutyrivibrio sp. YE44 TaxID=1520802 RepID=UPI000887FFA1|nr:hypothetical protein [Pseudobutyrivibrio sp. YE44]SDB51934.1 hypothetical protein SAMN02910298_02656 [Pseudobutyrivibrio sp. YE44]
MSDVSIYGAGAVDNGVSMNTTGVTSNGENVCQYAQNLKQVLDDFENVMVLLTTHNMSGYMSNEAMASYTGVRDSLYGYSDRIQTLGLTIQASAANIQAASQQAGDNIGIYTN